MLNPFMNTDNDGLCSAFKMRRIITHHEYLPQGSCCSETCIFLLVFKSPESSKKSQFLLFITDNIKVYHECLLHAASG